MPSIFLENDEFYYEALGQGEPLIFISGLGGDHSDWNRQLKSHSQSFHCITFDNRGIGRSEKALGNFGQTEYTLKLLAADIVHLLDALSIKKAHIVGASMGGVIAQQFALDYPERLLTLSLHSTWARISEKTRLKFETQLYFLPKVPVSDVQFMLAPMIWAERTLKDRIYIIEAFRERKKMNPVLISSEVYRFQVLACLSTDFMHTLDRIHVPVLITAGAEDGLIPPSESRMIHKAIPGSEFHLFQDCGHASNTENWRGFNIISLKFLKGHGGNSK